MQSVIKTINDLTQKDRDYINERTLKVTDNFQKNFNLEKSDKMGNEYWNNECDAFKHAYMQAYLTTTKGNLYSWGAGTYHGNTVSPQKVKEYKGNELSSIVEKSNSENFSDKIRQKYKSSINKYKDVFSKSTTKTAQDDVAGKWVTINGNHVLISS